ncbi:EAL domain-containing protein [Legionella londiniensis]|uniref:GGDEF domain-containing sensory box protein n=1 Tax=Legionella londiniensis TaxID=45068 RepID=A0A0W0VN54_9GAMM|nr:EAL domain-containing protein [Legionella londiniensis]KTD21600.1 GGDEF domain-containing sensory box protein [Legionella londiniensis]STX93371.1 sensory box protein, GGDEF family protein, LssE [Legionella londiniensis]
MQNTDFRIIIIDDNPNIHQDVIKVLTPHTSTDDFVQLDKALFGENKEESFDQFLPAFQFATASQGKEGLEKIKLAYREGKPYALAFVDVRMPPGWDGIETIKQIWKIDPEIQIVICTAHSDYSWEETIHELGMSDNFLILKKPFDNVAVRQLACALTQKWLLTKESKKQTAYLNQVVKEQTQSFQQSLSLLRATLESSTEGVLVVDLKGNIIDYNTRLYEMLGLPKSLLESGEESLFHEYLTCKMVEPDSYITNLDKLHKHKEISNRLVIKLNEGKIFECCSQPHRLMDKTVGRVWSFRDITERAFLEKKLEYQATHDALTELPNRVLLYDRIRQEIANSMRYNKQFAILFFDLDRFKLVNDSLGHEFGDKLLCQVAKRLSGMIRKVDTLARIGGDEFILLLSGLRHEEELMHIAVKLVNSFNQPFVIEGHELNITASIGITLYPTNGTTASKLLKNADLAMYQAKENGGNQFKYYTERLNKEAKLRLKQEMELRRAIANNEFFLVYQPQFDIRQQKFLSLEALIRWQHPKKGVILPISFIPAAEESGLIISLGEWVIQEVCKQINLWRQEGLPFMRVAVNVATQQLKQADFAETVSEILKKYKIPPEYLEIEITENVIVTHTEVLSMVKRLKKIGVRIVLDDFGTGNSCLNYLKQIKIDRLKIDRSFVANIARSQSDEVIIEAIIAMAQSMNFKVLAEGVENQQQINFLKKKQCDEVQGFFYCKPITPDLVVEYIKSVE